ncbi:hypothetical protein ACTJJ0_15725 [Chitinophaga sp. 22321]|uniref:Uncharacterized protein n=1 Tax=Chitinophaga hostae TaxID=2831022 RepID=A0ABS5J2M4_9BACT|nr:hypothetical protein [Chitinophaga hostae]MBS0029476.1 hypothetical protein [Chitinophaga hostae]
MTPEQLKEKLESKFKFTVQPPFGPYDFRFIDSVIYNENDIVADYIIESDTLPKHFKIILSNYRKFDKQLPTPYDNFENVTIEIDDDPDFPIYVNYSTRPDKQVLIISTHEPKYKVGQKVKSTFVKNENIMIVKKVRRDMQFSIQKNRHVFLRYSYDCELPNGDVTDYSEDKLTLASDS